MGKIPKGYQKNDMFDEVVIALECLEGTEALVRFVREEQAVYLKQRDKCAEYYRQKTAAEDDVTDLVKHIVLRLDKPATMGYITAEVKKFYVGKKNITPELIRTRLNVFVREGLISRTKVDIDAKRTKVVYGKASIFPKKYKEIKKRYKTTIQKVEP